MQSLGEKRTKTKTYSDAKDLGVNKWIRCFSHFWTISWDALQVIVNSRIIHYLHFLQGIPVKTLAVVAAQGSIFIVNKCQPGLLHVTI